MIYLNSKQQKQTADDMEETFKKLVQVLIINYQSPNIHIRINIEHLRILIGIPS